MKKIFGRILIVIPALAFQVGWYLLLLIFLDRLFNYHLRDVMSAVLYVLAVIFVINLVSKRDESSYKLLWAIVIVLLPILGSLLYFMLGNKSTGRRLKRNLQRSSEHLLNEHSLEDRGCVDEIAKEDPRLAQTLGHLSDSTHFPVFRNASSKYYPFGEDMFADMCKDLENARKFVFIEYFIIQSGRFWDTLTDILVKKVSEGVDVRVIYDDLGSIATYSLTDIRKLSREGIQCMAFNPFFLIQSQLNNRDHRKFMVIDGEIAYSGGVNLADEYINEKELFGRWKDIGFRITGDGVKSYTYMFAEFWNAFSRRKIEAELLNEVVRKINVVEEENGYILPYYDSPAREEHTSNVLFTEILSMAVDYVWFYTPYLMLGDALFDAFIRAAERGVDVRIIMPGIPDKKLVYRLSRSYYKDLIKAGVKIYEYAPGFVHAKAFLCDDKVCGIGSVNLDYRSLFLHFECSSVFYRADIIKELKRDYLDTQAECHAVTADSINRKILHVFIDNILRVLAPLM